MKFLVLSYTSASLDNDMDHAHVFYNYCTMVLRFARGLVHLFPYTAQGYTVVVHYCTAVAHCCIVVVHCCMVVVPG